MFQEVPEFFVYFSPSGIKFTHGTLMQLNFPLDRLKVSSRPYKPIQWIEEVSKFVK